MQMINSVCQIFRMRYFIRITSCCFVVVDDVVVIVVVVSYFIHFLLTIFPITSFQIKNVSLLIINSRLMSETSK